MDHNMSTPLGIILLIIFGIVSIAALLANGFIIVVNSHSWLKSRKFVPCDLLLTSLGIFRFLMQCFVLSGQFIYVSSPMDYMCSYAWKIDALAWMYFNMANGLGTTCLTVFYCMKVTTFSHPLFFWLKSRIDRLVPHMLVMSILAFVLFSISPVVGFWRVESSCSLARNLTANTSHSEALEGSLYGILNPLQFSFSAISFSISLTASIFLIVSLWRHTRNLKNSGIHTKDFSTQAHIEVIKQLMFFLFFYILYFVTMIIAMTNILIYGKVERLVSDIVFSLYPSAHSIILIRTNPKLKGVCTRILSSRERSS
ncbi:taste receptor type 2 member 7-like [Tiliqua scincoides]|uniref:taste receptor type 2 member 7-like n=1 Tax=Tiliqua scincoides TaxID=71010 RepID=UPI0034633DF0